MSTTPLEQVNQLQATLSTVEAVLNAMSDAVLWTNLDGTIQGCNVALERLMHCSRSTILGLKLSDLLPEIHSPRPIHQNGRILEKNVQPLQQGEATIGQVWIFRDTTERGDTMHDRQQAEEAFRRSELKYRHLFENSQAGIYRIRLGDGLIIEANQYAVEAIGYDSVDEVVDKKSTTDFYADLQQRDWVLGELMKHGKVTNYELQFRRRDGSIRWGMFNLRLNAAENWLEAVFTDITDRKRTEEALRRSELKYRHLFENSQVGIGRTRIEDGLFLDANQRCAEIVRLNSPADLIGKRFTNEFQVDPEARRLMLEELQQYGEVRDFETELQRADGSIGWGLFSLRRSPEESCFEFVIVDISDRKQLEEELRQSKQFLDSLIDNIPLALFAKDVNDDFRYVLINQNSELVLGFSREGAIGLNDYDLISPALADMYREQDQAVVRSGALLDIPEVEITLPDQPPFLARVIKLPLFDADGKPSHLMCIAEDITERKQVEEAIQRRAQIDGLLSSISRQLIDQDLQTAIRFTLQAIAQFIKVERTCIFEYSLDQSHLSLIDEWCAADVTPLSAAAQGGPTPLFPYLDQYLKNGRAFQFTSIVELPPESLERKLFESQSIQSLMAVPMIHANKVVGFIGADVIHFKRSWSQEDITLFKLVGELIAIGRARHQAEENLRIAKEAAEAANLAKSTFLANMSHELRTPLNAILGFSQLMERDTALNDRQRNFLTIINRSGEHLLDLINDVLEMSKIEAGCIELNVASFDLHRLLQTLQDMFHVRAEAKKLLLHFDIAPDLPQFIYTDESKLRQVLINLLGNSIKFTHTGSVTLRVACSNFSIARTDDPITLRFEIEDTGRGIAPEEMNRLFQPFVQTSSGTQAQEGTGLGLTISRQFVRLMDGELRCTSQLGHGSTFFFEIRAPLGDAAQVVAPLTPQRVLNLMPGQPTYRILIVDDRAENRDLIEQLLTTVGFETQTAINGQAAIACWKTWQPHLIWMDMRMPILDGYAATRQIRSQERSARRTKIIALTASAFEEQRATILAAGCDDLVSKPFREHIIFEKMAKHLGVQYVYADEPEALPEAEPKLNLQTLKNLLLEMPTDWIVALHKAALAVDADQILRLIGQIPVEHRSLAQGLSALVHEFCFDEILELAQSDR
jgi:PAS domain S-box-containing protein